MTYTTREKACGQMRTVFPIIPLENDDLREEPGDVSAIVRKERLGGNTYAVTTAKAAAGPYVPSPAALLWLAMKGKPNDISQ